MWHKNRHGNLYSFVKVPNSNTYSLQGDLDCFRVGGLEGQEKIDSENLGFIDPSGGPFISVGGEIKGKKIKRIYQRMQPVFLFEVEE